MTRKPPSARIHGFNLFRNRFLARITLARELSHLLLDRGGLRNLARFEGGTANSDRLIEMRANAFAVELLVPMATLVEADGVVVDDARLADISVKQQVSARSGGTRRTCEIAFWSGDATDLLCSCREERGWPAAWPGLT
jgi:Zn-dependent peptidase ImmA (M78 family)